MQSPQTRSVRSAALASTARRGKVFCVTARPPRAQSVLQASTAALQVLQAVHNVHLAALSLAIGALALRVQRARWSLWTETAALTAQLANIGGKVQQNARSAPQADTGAEPVRQAAIARDHVPASRMEASAAIILREAAKGFNRPRLLHPSILPSSCRRHHPLLPP